MTLATTLSLDRLHERGAGVIHYLPGEAPMPASGKGSPWHGRHDGSGIGRVRRHDLAVRLPLRWHDVLGPDAAIREHRWSPLARLVSAVDDHGPVGDDRRSTKSDLPVDDSNATRTRLRHNLEVHRKRPELSRDGSLD